MPDYRDRDPRDRDPRDYDERDGEFTRPAFNVCVPFQNVIMVQMDLLMRNLLFDFFKELVDNETEEEIIGFRDALKDPSIFIPPDSAEPSEPSFLFCETYMNVIVIQMNNPMRDLIRKFIEEIDGRIEDEIWAFNRALANPEASRKIREMKRLGRFNRRPEPETPPPPPSKIRRRKLITQ